MQLSKNLYWFIYIFLAAISCARQTSPTGGPKDTIPPKLVYSNPPLEAINFKGNKLELEFTEMVITNNPREELIVTPSIGKDFEMTAKKNSVVIDFQATLEDSTTYTFNFREAVQDITEKNPVRNLQVAFSTGPYIDSLSIQGSVYDLFKGKELKDATVAIHVPNDTFSILQHQATFFTKTNDNGNFIIDHLKPGQYYLYAFLDKNKNLIADSRTEFYGFLTTPITLTSDTSELSVGVVKLDTRPLKVTSARPYNTYFNIRTSKNLSDFTVTAQDSSKLYYSFGEDQSNIRIYNNLENQDSIAVRFIGRDSINNVADTTVYAKFLQREVIPEKFDSKLSGTSIIADKGLLSATMTFTKPIKEINYDSIFFQPDSLTNIHVTEDDIAWDYPHNKLTITKILDKQIFEPKLQPPADPTTTESPQDSLQSPTPGNQPPSQTQPLNQLYIGHASFISIDNDSSKRITQTIKPLKPEDLSKIIYDIGTDHKNFLVQILDKSLNIIKEKEDELKGEFTDLVPGEYIMRVVIDRNDNKQWDPGNYLIKEEPESIYYYQDEEGSSNINLKANWDFQLAPMLITH